MGGRDRGGRMADMGPDKTDSDWRARPSADDDGPPRRDDTFGESKSEMALFLLHQYLLTLEPRTILLADLDRGGLFLNIIGVPI